jgi:hypothetical protein
MQIAIWLITAIVLALWSLAGWGLYHLVDSGVQLIGDLKPLIDRIPYAAIVEQWIPGWQDMLKLMLDLLQSLLGWLGGAAPLLVCLLWAVGTGLLLVIAGVLSLAVALIRKSMPPVPPGSQPPGPQPPNSQAPRPPQLPGGMSPTA